MAREVASRNIRVNAICTGWIDTPMTQPLTAMMRMLATSQIPLRRFADPREVATTALFLASDDSSYVAGVDNVQPGVDEAGRNCTERRRND